MLRVTIERTFVRMPANESSDISRILDAVNADQPGAESRLLDVVHAELRRIAAASMRNESPGHSLSPTALVNEAYLRLFGAGSEGQWNGRGHFFSAAAQAMRQILVDHARRKKRLKRGGDRIAISINADQIPALQKSTADEVLKLDEALGHLASEDPALVRLVELRFFNGHTIQEAAEILDISVRTANRSWKYARARLWQMLEDESGV
jgi:RNA polymerase sigma factor (TIGR02999 family)